MNNEIKYCVNSKGQKIAPYTSERNNENKSSTKRFEDILNTFMFTATIIMLAIGLLITLIK